MFLQLPNKDYGRNDCANENAQVLPLNSQNHGDFMTYENWYTKLTIRWPEISTDKAEITEAIMPGKAGS